MTFRSLALRMLPLVAALLLVALLRVIARLYTAVAGIFGLLRARIWLSEFDPKVLGPTLDFFIRYRAALALWSLHRFAVR